MSDIETIREAFDWLDDNAGDTVRAALDRLEAEVTRWHAEHDKVLLEAAGNAGSRDALKERDRKLVAEVEKLREASERVKGLVPEWRERGRHKPEFAGGYYFILADELEAALADQQEA